MKELTPKEKAFEIYHKFRSEMYGTGLKPATQAKQCALIAVEEKINILNELYEFYVLSERERADNNVIQMFKDFEQKEINLKQHIEDYE